MNELTKALHNAWAQWPIIKDTVPDYGFKDWVKRVGGFTYMQSLDRRNVVIDRIYNESLYAWFVLRWS